jgi:Rhodopirellula transposase DDE domain
MAADGGGSNGRRSRLWKVELQKFSDTIVLEVSVCHFPPGTSKWNKIEHRWFWHMTRNWRGFKAYGPRFVETCQLPCIDDAR